MKRLGILLCTLFAVSGASWGAGSTDAGASSGTSELAKIKVAVMPFFLSAPVNYIKEQGWDKQAGLDMEIVMFSNGAAMNEALGANLWDIAPTGGAAIYGVANFQAKFVADFIDGTGGNEMYVRGDSKIAKVKGYNPKYPDLLGDPESVRGATILQTSGTTSQMNVVKYLQAMGLKDTDVKIVHMEFPQVYQGFLTGQGDIASMVSPYVFKAPEQGWVKASSLTAVNARLFETVIANPKSYERMKKEMATFLHLLYRANEALEKDPALKQAEVKKWYVKNGAQVTDDQIKLECSLKTFLTKDMVRNIEYGAFQKDYAAFLVSIQKLKAEQVATITQNTVRDILDMALAQK